MKKIDKRGIDTSTLNFIIVVFVIGLIIGALYLWMGTITVNRQENALRSNLARFELDSAVSGWVADTPNLPALDFNQLGTSFQTWFTSHGYTVDSFSCNTETYQPNERNLICDFSATKGDQRLSGNNYGRYVFIPTPSGGKRILLRSS